MAKMIKRSRNKKKSSLRLHEISQKMDDIIGQIDNIKKPKNTKKLRRSKRSEKSETDSSVKKSPMSHSERSKFLQKISNSKTTSQQEKKKGSQMQMASSLSRDQKRSDQKYSRLEQERQTRKLINFKSMMNSKTLQKSRQLYKEKLRSRDFSEKEKNPLKLTSELDDIFKTISSLEQQELGKTYHREREKKLKTLMRSSKLADIRKNMNLKREDSEYWLNTQSEMKSNDHLDKNFTMKKCPKCSFYFPLEKIAKHCRNCKK